MEALAQNLTLSENFVFLTFWALVPERRQSSTKTQNFGIDRCKNRGFPIEKHPGKGQNAKNATPKRQKTASPKSNCGKVGFLWLKMKDWDLVMPKIVIRVAENPWFGHKTALKFEFLRFLHFLAVQAISM